MIKHRGMSLFEKVQSILIRPKNRWPEIRDEETTIRDLYLPYVIILAGIPVLARLIGSTVIGMSFFHVRYRTPFFDALGYAVLSYALSLAGMYVFAFIIQLLAPRFLSEKSITKALRLTVYSSTAYWVAGVLFMVPDLHLAGFILSLYGLYLLYLGLPVMLATPKKEVLPFFGLIIAVGFILFVLTSLLATLIFPEGRLGAA